MQFLACVRIAQFPCWAVTRKYGTSCAVVAAVGKVVSVSPGINTDLVGKSVDDVLECFPECIVYQRDIGLEAWMRDRFFRYLFSYTPWISTPEIWGTDLYFFMRALELEALRRLCSHPGLCGGMAPERLVARLVCAVQDSGVERVDLLCMAHFLATVSVRRLGYFGFSGQMVGKLHKLGFFSLDMLMRLQQQQLYAQFGQEGRTLHAFLHSRGRSVPLYRPDWQEVCLTFDTQMNSIEYYTRETVYALGVVLDELPGKLVTYVETKVGVADTRVYGLKCPLRDAGHLAQVILKQVLIGPRPPVRVHAILGGLVEMEQLQQNFLHPRGISRCLIENLVNRYPGKCALGCVDAGEFFVEDAQCLRPLQVSLLCTARPGRSR